jgi:hypothetical protein
MLGRDPALFYFFLAYDNVPYDSLRQTTQAALFCRCGTALKGRCRRCAQQAADSRRRFGGLRDAVLEHDYSPAASPAVADPHAISVSHCRSLAARI